MAHRYSLATASFSFIRKLFVQDVRPLDFASSHEVLAGAHHLYVVCQNGLFFGQRLTRKKAFVKIGKICQPRLYM